MLEIYLNEMTDAILEAKTLDRESIKEALRSYWNDKIADIWEPSDVISYAKASNNITLSRSQAIEVLKNMAEGYDAEFGYNWNMLKANLDDFLRHSQDFKK